MRSVKVFETVVMTLFIFLATIIALTPIIALPFVVNRTDQFACLETLRWCLLAVIFLSLVVTNKGIDLICFVYSNIKNHLATILPRHQPKGPIIKTQLLLSYAFILFMVYCFYSIDLVNALWLNDSVSNKQATIIQKNIKKYYRKGHEHVSYSFDIFMDKYRPINLDIGRIEKFPMQLFEAVNNHEKIGITVQTGALGFDFIKSIHIKDSDFTIKDY